MYRAKTQETTNYVADRTGQVVDMYRTIGEELFDSYQGEIDNISVLGSYGTGWPTTTSDLDVQIVWRDGAHTSLDDLAQLSELEMSKRKELSDTLRLGSLTRHRASIFSYDEWCVYMKTFVWSFLYPRELGEFEHISGNRYHDGLVLDGKTNLYDVDYLVSLEHKLNSYLSTGKKKHLRRGVRDVYWKETGRRTKDNPEMDALLARLHDAPSYLGGYLARLREVLLGNDLTRSIKLHELSYVVLWTLEKTRWEMISSMANNNYRDLWSRGESEGFGFGPQEMSSLVQRTHQELPQLDEQKKNQLLGVLNCVGRGDGSPDCLRDLHHLYSCRTMEVMSHINQEKKIASPSFSVHQRK